MKSSTKILTRYFLYFVFTFSVLGLTSCSNDDDLVTPAPTGSIDVEDQTISQNQIRIDQVVSSSDGFLVARLGTQIGTIIAQEDIDQGTHEDIVLQLEDQENEINIQDGNIIVISLYADSDANGNFNEANDAQVATESITVSSPTFSVADQAVVDNTITVENISAGEDSFLVAFGENEDGTINEDDVLGSAFVPAGQTQSATITFEEGKTPVAGTAISTRLHRDVNRDGIFDPTLDTPETFNFNAPDNTVVRRSQIL